jgi:hypothetical protein
MKSSNRHFTVRALPRMLALFLASGLPSVALAQNVRGSATGPTTAKGYDHPGQYLTVQDVKPADNMYPVVRLLESLVFTDTGGGIVFNLYTNPQEDVSIGIRHIPAAVPIMAAAGWYVKELIKYPPQFKIGFMTNNPPVYDLLPKAREMLEKNANKASGADALSR